jgi:hypothetical protein
MSRSVTGALHYAECRHRWWQKLGDWVRLRHHPPAHVLRYSAMYKTAKQLILDGDLVDLDAETFTIRLIWTEEDPS